MPPTPINLTSLRDFHEALQRLLKAHDSGDTETERDILRQFVEFEKAGYQRKLKLLAELKSRMTEARAKLGTVEEQVTRLLDTFKFSAQLRRIGYDELDDRETADKATKAIADTANLLAQIPPRHLSALAVLLDDPNLHVRVAAAAWLLDIMPEQATSVLEHIDAMLGTAAIDAGFRLARHRQKTGNR